ncbi:MAPEG family protein [Aurantiacibacter sp. MUD11]|uniref:MAPEG family protein n=1 Tax=Aurantiacibacter sp. MUD11 TaxID=3003265 RepID=UPI0022AAD85C|nr:MAPEG family protein [Aurantiacibacter sp. MUD11]WAT18597.1 MAPEG family protein [Aurantiacibacter sp. MUD11]
MNFELLAPAAALAVWSMIMLIWMAALRLPALAKLEMPAEKSRGGRGSDLDGVLPGPIQWKAHNYNHLMEQPTVFYAVVIILFLAGGTQTDLYLAWAYVGIRVVHSLWQSVVNTIPIRLTLFTISSIVLAALAVRALLATI